MDDDVEDNDDIDDDNDDRLPVRSPYAWERQ